MNGRRWFRIGFVDFMVRGELPGMFLHVLISFCVWRFSRNERDLFKLLEGQTLCSSNVFPITCRLRPLRLDSILVRFIVVRLCDGAASHHLPPFTSSSEIGGLDGSSLCKSLSVGVGLEAEAALQHAELLRSGDSGGALKPYITLPFTQGQIYHTITDDCTQGHPPLPSCPIPQHPTISPPSSTTLSSSSPFNFIIQALAAVRDVG